MMVVEQVRGTHSAGSRYHKLQQDINVILNREVFNLDICEVISFKAGLQKILLTGAEIKQLFKELQSSGP